MCVFVLGGFSFACLVCVFVCLFVSRLRKTSFLLQNGYFCFFFFSFSLSSLASFSLRFLSFSFYLLLLLFLLCFFLPSFLRCFLVFYPSFYPSFFIAFQALLYDVSCLVFFASSEEEVENVKLERFPSSIISPVCLFGFLSYFIIEIHFSYLLASYLFWWTLKFYLSKKKTNYKHQYGNNNWRLPEEEEQYEQE